MRVNGLLASRLFLFSICLGLTCLALLSPHASAAWIEDGVPLCTATDLQSFPQAVSDGNGGAIIVWWDMRNGRDNDLYAQRIDAAGNLLWASQGVPVCTEAGEQTWVAAVSDGAGGAIITWQDARACSTCEDIYAQRIDGNGNRLWNAMGAGGILICGASLPQSMPRIISDDLQGAIIVWPDERNSYGADLYAQRVSAAGIPLWTANGVPVSTAPVMQERPRMISDGVSGAYIVWQDGRTGGSAYYNIYVQHLDRDGAPLLAVNGLAICTAPENQLWPEIDSDGSGGAIIAWSDHRGTDYDTYAQRLLSTGAIAWTPDGVPVSIYPSEQMDPYVVSDEQGNTIVIWRDARAGNSDLYAQRLDRNGVRLWHDTDVPICTAAGHQITPAMIPDGLGGAIMAWEDPRDGDDDDDIYVQRVDSGGTPLWAENGTVMCSAPSEQRRVSLAPDASHGAIVTWQDNREPTSTSWDVYAQSSSFLPQSGAPQATAATALVGELYPNPCGSTAWIPFTLERTGAVSLRVYDAAGVLVRHIGAGVLGPARHRLEWDGRNDQGRLVASGTYFCVVGGPGLQNVRRVVRLH
jgi:hypothetical protein